MWKTLTTSVKTTLDKLVGSSNPLQVVYDYPESNITGYPAVIFFPTNYTNEYDSVQENAKTYVYSVYVLLELKVLGKQTAYNTTMPDILDKIIAEFDKDWNQGQTVNQNRVWWNLSSGAWLLVDTDSQKEAFLQAELTLTIRTNNNI